MTNVEKMAAKVLELQAQRDELDEAIKNMRATIAENIDLGENFIGEFKLVKTMTTRFDDAMAKKNLTPAEYDSIAVPKADSKRAAALLDEDRLALCKKTFDAQVRIALRD
jgi:hypothetical protein